MAQLPDRLITALADRYRIERELGAGGMATVYLAQDLKHDRLVAVKVLKPELAAVLGAERFVVEIKTTAALQHPHILPLFDSGEAGGFLYYVMPFIEGETLRSKLDRESQLGVDEAVKLTCDVADALEYAHQHGVIHRDIKPENILLQSGRPMVADFGIALAVSAAAGGRMTETGLSLGTPHYMSPEQATAEREITARSDQYSLASVLYEMLTGNPPHTGATAQQIIMKIITEQAQDVTALRKSVPRAVADAVAQALEKLPADRFVSVAAFAAALGGEQGAQGPLRGARATAHRAQLANAAGPWRRLSVAAGVVAIGATAVALWALGQRGAGGGQRVEFTYRPIFDLGDRPYTEISNDGQRIVQVVRDTNGLDVIAVRELGSAAMRVLPGTEGARDPEITPDGAWIVFQAQGKLQRIPATGGPATLVVDSANTSGVGVLPNGDVLFTRTGRGLFRVPGAGGPDVQLTTLDSTRREFAHWYPEALPGGKTVIFNNFSLPTERSRIEALDLATGKRTVLIEGGIFPRYAASGHLLFARAGAIFAVPFDAKAVRVLGSPVPVVEDLDWSLTDGLGSFAVSDNGTLVYARASEGRVDRRVVWSDRAGNLQDAMPDAGGWSEPRRSPDGRWLAVTRSEPTRQIWLYDNARQVVSQLTRFTDGVAFGTVWMPDSRSVIFSREVPQYDLYRQPIDGSAAVPVLETANDKVASGVSRDGEDVVYYEVISQDRLMIAPIRGGPARAVDPRPTDQRNADFSPDGRWLAYDEFNSTGTTDVYVRALSGAAGRRTVSAAGGDQPRFTRNGREITYRKGAAMFAASFDPATGEVGTPKLLFSVPDGGRLAGGRTVGYDVTPDGSRFLLVTPIERPRATPNVVVINWFEELRRKSPR